MDPGKTLVPILCMHRSGSSLTTNILSELGMALGPFDLMGATDDNRYGHFESMPFYELDWQVQRLALGFKEDMPESPEALRRFVESEGRWPEGVGVPPEWFDRGEELVRQLLASDAISGFKDPRLPLVWPFWAEVFRRFSGLRVVPLVLLRSPHEIAMSMFMRLKGGIDYCDALDVAAVHYKRIRAILADWPGPVARVRFLPEYYADDLRAACRLLGLAWSEEVYIRVLDVECKHHEPAAVAHPAQALFEQLTELPRVFTRGNALRIEADALTRERLLRRSGVDAKVELHSAQTTLANMQVQSSAAEAESERLAAELFAKEAEVKQLAADARRLAVQLSATQAEAGRLAVELSTAHANAGRLEAELELTKASRVWRLRELLVGVPGLKQLANRPPRLGLRPDA